MPTYGDIRTTFLDRLKRRDCTTTLADGFIADAIRRIQRTIDVPAGEKSVTWVISNENYLNAGGLAIPSDYLRLRDLTHTDAAGLHTVLRKAPLQETLGAVDYGIQGLVRKYTRQGTSWVLGPLPQVGDGIRADYYSEYEDVSQPTDESVLLDIAPDLIIFGSLSIAADHWNDIRGPKFEQRFVQSLGDIQGQADDDEVSGDACVAQAFYYPPDHL